MTFDDLISQLPPDLLSSPYIKTLIQIIQTQAEQLQALKEENRELKDEIARLQKRPKRPKFRPGIQQRNRSGKAQPPDSPQPNHSSTSRIREEVRIAPENLPLDSRFKGFQTFKVEDVELKAKEVTYKLEVWQTPDGKIVHGKLPPELQGKHFGVVLRTLVLDLYAHGMTQPALLDFLVGIGVCISSGQLNNLLLDEGEGLFAAGEEILAAGLREAPYIRVDDTGEKHQHKNCYCTHIGGEHFAYYRTTSSKSRANFLRLLLQDTPEGYVVNDAMIWHLFQSGVEDAILNLFEELKGKRYKSKRGLHRLLNGLGIVGKKLRSQCLEACLVGFISETILRPGQVLLSDRAGQFAVFDHAACWVHMERPLRKLKLTSPTIEREWRRVRSAIWELYGVLKEALFNQARCEEVHRLYDDLVAMKSSSPAITTVLSAFRLYREEMLKALDHPGLPLHNNDSEQDIRGVAKRRKLSGSTKSDTGRKFRDGLLTIKQTCFRLGISLWDYLLKWCSRDPPNLGDLIVQRYRAAHS